MTASTGQTLVLSLGIHAALAATLALFLGGAPVAKPRGPVAASVEVPVVLEAPEPPPAEELPPAPRDAGPATLEDDAPFAAVDPRFEAGDAEPAAGPTTAGEGIVGIGGGRPGMRPRGVVPRAAAVADVPVPVEAPEPAPGPTSRAVPVASACRAPDYPERDRRLGAEGLVELLVSVAADGSVESVEILRSSGRASLDRAAVEAVRSWRFEPALREGVAVPDVVIVPVRFVLVSAANR